MGTLLSFLSILSPTHRFTGSQRSIILGGILLLLSALLNYWWLFTFYLAALGISIYVNEHLVVKRDLLPSQDFLINLIYVVKKIQLYISDGEHQQLQTTVALKSVENSSVEFQREHFVLCILKTFVHDWYDEISRDQECPGGIHTVIDDVFARITQRITSVSKFNFVEYFIKLYAEHVKNVKNATKVLQQQPTYRKRTSGRPEVTKFATVEDTFRHKGLFHPAMKRKHTEQAYLQEVTRLLFEVLLQDSAVECTVAREALNEIIKSNLLVNILDLFSDTYWLHKVIIIIVSDESLVQCMPATVSCGDSRPMSTNGTSNHEGQVSCEQADVKNGSKQPDFLSTSDFVGSSRALPNRNTLTHDANTSKHSDSDMSVYSTEYALEAFEEQTSETDCSHNRMAPPKQFFRDVSPTNEASIVDQIRIPSTDHTPSPCSPNGASALSFNQVETYKQPPNKENAGLILKNGNATSTDQLHIPNPMKFIAKLSDLGSRIVSTDDDQASVQNGDEIAKPEHLFQDACIPKTVPALEAGTRAVYTLYIIKYNAWHLTETEWVLQEKTLQRRYREFVTLQNELEQCPGTKAALKGIKTPQRWNIMPLGALNEASIEKRRIYLETYLQALTSHTTICLSKPLKLFLAYEGDSRIAFMKKALDIPVPRIDRVLAKTFSGVVDKISTVLPSFPGTEMPGALLSTLSDVTAKKALMWQDPDKVQVNLSVAPSLQESPFATSIPQAKIQSSRMFERTLIHHLETSFPERAANPRQSSPILPRIDEFLDVSEHLPLITVPRSPQGNKKFQSDNILPSELNISSSVLSLAVQIFEGYDVWATHERALHVLSVLLGHGIDSWLKKEINELTNEQQWTFYIYMLRETLWPGGVFDGTEQQAPSPEQRQITEDQAKRCLFEFFPGFLPYVIGSNEMRKALDELFLQIEHKELNKSFILNVLDLLLETLIPEISTWELQQKLLADDIHYPDGCS